MRVLDIFDNICWRIYRYFTDNYKYIVKYKDTGDLKYLRKYILKSRSIDLDIDEVVNYCRCYEFEVNGYYSHAHCLKQLFIMLMDFYENGTGQEIILDKDTFHKDELVMVEKFIKELKNREV